MNHEINIYEYQADPFRYHQCLHIFLAFIDFEIKKKDYPSSREPYKNEYKILWGGGFLLT